LGVAGIWEVREGSDGPQYSFALLTINADDHPVMNRMHKPGEEKRMVVILEPGSYEEWLHVKPEHAPSWLTQFPAERLVAEPARRGDTRQDALL
jgi:putative SOS response-associated peptidase YedK